MSMRGVFCAAALCFAGCGPSPELIARCQLLCDDASFSSSAVDEEADVTACFCQANDGPADGLDADSCKSFCDDVGKANAETFKQLGTSPVDDSCRCT